MKDDSPLFVDSNTVITSEITLQIFETIAWGRAQIVQMMSGVKNIQFS